VFVASAALGVVLPEYGLVPGGEYQAGSLRGIMLDRNSLSFVLLIGLIATLVFEFRGRADRERKVILCALFFGGVLWTASSTCLILSVVAIVLAVELALLRRVPASRRGRAAAGGALITSVGALYITAHFDEVLRLVERDPSLTGRTRVWPAVQNLISQEPWLGQGWGGVWGNESIRQQLARSIGFDVPHAHNGYLDIQVQVGGVGLGLLLLVLLLVGVRGVAYYLRSDSPLSSWALILTVVLILYNRVETSFPAPSTLFLMFATLVVLQKTQSRGARDADTR
jgi:O-antigen ligase